MAELSGYFGNGIAHWRDQLVWRDRQLKARLRTLQRTGHPIAHDQEVLIEINTKMIQTLDRQLRKALETKMEAYKGDYPPVDTRPPSRCCLGARRRNIMKHLRSPLEAHIANLTPRAYDRIQAPASRSWWSFEMVVLYLAGAAVAGLGVGAWI